MPSRHHAAVPTRIAVFGGECDAVWPLLSGHGVRCIAGNYDVAIGPGDEGCGCRSERDNHLAQLTYEHTRAATSPARALAGLTDARELGLPLRVAMTETPENRGEGPRLRALLAGIGFAPEDVAIRPLVARRFAADTPLAEARRLVVQRFLELHQADGTLPEAFHCAI